MARKRTPPRRSGLLLLDKPAGWTSHDVVGRTRRFVRERQVGHAGTLDPAATGLLPVAIGHATKLLPYVDDTSKTYVATVRFGVSTDSGDRDGRLLERQDASGLTSSSVRDALHQFRGEIEQVPPKHSAIKVGGRKLYDLARAGKEVEVPVRRVTIDSIELASWHAPEATIVVNCSAGTYIRSLAMDLGTALGCGAMLSRLTRTRVGRFSLGGAISIHDLEARLDRWGWSTIAYHPDALLPESDPVVLDIDDESRWLNGMPVRGDATTSTVRVYDARSNWVGIGDTQAGTGTIKPKRVVRGRSE